MTPQEALKRACLDMFLEGHIVVKESSPWGFRYSDETLVPKETVEERAAKYAGKTLLESYIGWDEFSKVCTGVSRQVLEIPLTGVLF